MKKRLLFMALVSVGLLGQWLGASWADSPDALREKVWQTYLRAPEAAALGAISASNQEFDQNAPPLTPANAAGLRKNFAAAIAAASPPLDGLSSSPWDENGIKGLWLRGPNADPERALLYLHGGAYVLGSPATALPVSASLAARAGLVCFSLDYPLAPEHPFPAALDNALAAYKMLLDKGFKPERIVLAGDSAGGGLALATLLNIRDRGLPLPAGAFLLSPWADLSNSLPSRSGKSQLDSILTGAMLRAAAAMYAAGASDLKNPLLSPAWADLRGLPPLLIHVGSFELLLDDSLTIARNAAWADVPVRLALWPGYCHVFQYNVTALEGARQSLEEGAAFLRQVMDNRP
jgi:acetyl esterase/lipase